MMENCFWERIDAFNSPGEYSRFVQWIENQVKDDLCEELTEEGTNKFKNWGERRFRCKMTGQIWKLLCPDPGYFPGSWSPEE